MTAVPPERDDAPTLRIVPHSPWIRVDTAWEDFRDRHAGWLAGLPRDGPIYALPAAVIDRLARVQTRTRAALDAAAEPAERDLADLCRRCQVVGFHEGRPIVYPALVAEAPDF